MVAARAARPIPVLIRAMNTPPTMTQAVMVSLYPALRLFPTTHTEMRAVLEEVCTQMDRSGLVVEDTTVMICVPRLILPLLHRLGIKRCEFLGKVNVV